MSNPTSFYGSGTFDLYSLNQFERCFFDHCVEFLFGVFRFPESGWLYNYSYVIFSSNSLGIYLMRKLFLNVWFYDLGDDLFFKGETEDFKF